MRLIQSADRPKCSCLETEIANEFEALTSIVLNLSIFLHFVF